MYGGEVIRLKLIMRQYVLSWIGHTVVWIIYALIYIVGYTLQFQCYGKTDVWSDGNCYLMSLWHNTILPNLFFHRNRGAYILVSSSHIGEIITKVLQKFGYIVIRGSSTHDGAVGAKNICKALNDGKICAITPDGSRGPRHKIHNGIITISNITNAKIVPVGTHVDACITIPTWDRLVIPMPFAKVTIVYGEPITGDNASVQKAMDDITTTALYQGLW
jgi:hypothetical protein